MTRFTIYAASSSIVRASTWVGVATLALGLGGCPRPPEISPALQSPPPVVPTLPPPFPPQELVGKWGLAAYHSEEDRARTELAAVNQCRQPYVITLGSTGGVMMHLADEATLTELRLKGSPSGKTYVGPADQPPGSMKDREFVVFNEREMILRWMDPEVQGRYGTMVYMRCTPESPKRRAPRAKSPANPKAPAKPAS